MALPLRLALTTTSLTPRLQCASKAFPDAPANLGVLNIVDLSKIVLERE